ncbi:MAG: hypothetical protein ACRDF5_05535 [bacterium]
MRNIRKSTGSPVRIILTLLACAPLLLASPAGVSASDTRLALSSQAGNFLGDEAPVGAAATLVDVGGGDLRPALVVTTKDPNGCSPEKVIRFNSDKTRTPAAGLTLPARTSCANRSDVESILDGGSAFGAAYFLSHFVSRDFDVFRVLPDLTMVTPFVSTNCVRILGLVHDTGGLFGGGLIAVCDVGSQAELRIITAPSPAVPQVVSLSSAVTDFIDQCAIAPQNWVYNGVRLGNQLLCLESVGGQNNLVAIRSGGAVTKLPVPVLGTVVDLFSVYAVPGKPGTVFDTLADPGVFYESSTRIHPRREVFELPRSQFTGDEGAVMLIRASTGARFIGLRGSSNFFADAGHDAVYDGGFGEPAGATLTCDSASLEKLNKGQRGTIKCTLLSGPALPNPTATGAIVWSDSRCGAFGALTEATPSPLPVPGGQSADQNNDGAADQPFNFDAKQTQLGPGDFPVCIIHTGPHSHDVDFGP